MTYLLAGVAAIAIIVGGAFFNVWAVNRWEGGRPAAQWQPREGVVPVRCPCGFTGPVDVWWQRVDGYYAKCPDCGSSTWVTDRFPGGV